jgi:hypothetical protein
MPGGLAVMSVAAVETDLPLWSIFLPLVGAGVGLIGVLWTLWVNGDRAERTRRRELRARCLAAVLAYREMPFMIRRRRTEADERSAERVRLSSHFSAVQTELSTCEHLLRADGPDWLASKYQQLVSVARATAGREAHEAWQDEPIARDAEMNMPELFARLEPLNDQVDSFRKDIGWADKTRRGKAIAWRMRPRDETAA